MTRIKKGEKNLKMRTVRKTVEIQQKTSLFLFDLLFILCGRQWEMTGDKLRQAKKKKEDETHWTIRSVVNENEIKKFIRKEK